MNLRVTCSWCHAEVEIDRRTHAVYCGTEGCGHRADVPRLDCDCDTCRPKGVISGPRDRWGRPFVRRVGLPADWGEEG